MANAQRIGERSIFLEALQQHDPTQQAAYLDVACADDPALRLRVEALLHSHNMAGSFFSKLAPERVAEDLAGEQTAVAQHDPTSAHGLDGVELNFLSPTDKPDSLGRLGSYEVQEVIGRGGMGIVLRAFDEKLHRVVAIKVMTAPLATNATARKRFTREARSAAAVSHDHVVTIHGVEETSDLPYLVMQYVSGVSLQERLDKSGSLQLHEILRIGMQTANGLAAAHAQGLVHRDIKPANILLENGVERVKITDFGLAHAVDDVRTTQPGTLIGTPEYMSPEQARGEKVDHRSDLFSLGCVLYAMCAGRPPFRAESTVAIIRRVCDDTPRPLVEVNPEIPEWLVDLIDKLIAKDASERFQSAAEVAELLGQYLAHVQQPAVNPQPAAIAKPRPLRRRTSAHGRRRWSIAVAAVLLLCAGLSLAETTGVTSMAATVIRIVRGDGTLVVEVDDPNIQVLVDGEELVISGAGPKEIRLRTGEHELHMLKDGKPSETKLITITRDGRQVVKVAQERQEPAAPTTRLVWANAANLDGVPSPDGKYVCYMDWDSGGNVGVYELATGENRRLTNQGGTEFGLNPIFSPDSQQVAYSWFIKDKGSQLRVVGLDGSPPRLVYPNQDKDVLPLQPRDWSGDGKHILADSFKRGAGAQIVLVTVADGSVRVLKTLDRGRPEEKMSLSPDGRYVAYGVRPSKRDIYVLSTDGSGDTPLVEHPADDYVLGWTADGKRLVFASDRSGSMGVWTLAVADGKPLGSPELVKPELGRVQAMGISRNGSLFFGISSGGQNVYTATLDLEQNKLLAPPIVAIQHGEGSNWTPAWSPDGRYLACQSRREAGTTFFIRSSGSNEVRELVPNPTGQFNISSLNWSPDGLSLLGSNGMQVDVATGAVTRLVRSREMILYSQWAPDGKGVFFTGSTAKSRRRILRQDIESGVEQEVATEHATFLTLSPDGQQLAFAVGEVLKVLPTTGGGEPRALVTGDRFITTIAWTPDGRHLLFGKSSDPEKWQQAPSELWRIPIAGGESQKLADDMPAMLHLRFHPDGHQIAFSAHSSQSGKSEVWVLENFLPPLPDSKTPVATDASAAQSK